MMDTVIYDSQLILIDLIDFINDLRIFHKLIFVN